MVKRTNSQGRKNSKIKDSDDDPTTKTEEKTKQAEIVQEQNFFGCFGKIKSSNADDDADEDKAEQLRIKNLGYNNLTPEQRERAQKNWRRLKMRVKEMREQPNFLVMFLDERDEQANQKMEGYEQNGGESGTHNVD